MWCTVHVYECMYSVCVSGVLVLHVAVIERTLLPSSEFIDFVLLS